MSPPLLFLLLPFLIFTAGFAQNSNSSTPASPSSDLNQTSVTQLPTQKPRTTPERIKFIVEGSDYDYEDDETTVASISAGPMLPCQYDKCEHLAPSCEDLQRHTGCLCPGVDGPQIKPESPLLKEVLPGDTQMTLHWCSPSSTVRGYRVLYGQPGGLLEKGPEINSSFRSFTIDNLHSGSTYTVCVVAFNEAGESLVDDEDRGEVGTRGPCRSVHTSMQSLYIGLGIGLAALVGLLIILGYFLWIRKTKMTKTVTNREEKGLPNYTYKAGSIEQL